MNIKANFADTLIKAIQEKNSVVCVGLDPQVDRIPNFIMQEMEERFEDQIEAYANAILAFNKGIIDSIYDLAVLVKPQSAFYEILGHHGIWALEQTCIYARERGLLVLLDAKRGDIGSTAEAYAEAYLAEDAPYDALTINAYLGADGVMPFLDKCGTYGKGIFILVKTSNPSSGDLQDRITVDEQISIAELMANFVSSWGFDHIGENEYSSVGAVVGATHPKQISSLRKIMPNTLFLVPGYGVQGANANDVKDAFDENGLGAVINSSRGILYAYENVEGPQDGSHFAQVAREACEAMKDALNYVRNSK